MDNIRYFFNDSTTMVDWSSEKDIIKSCKEFFSFDALASELYTLRVAFNNEIGNGGYMGIYTIPNIQEVSEILVGFRIKRKLFSKEVKEKFFDIHIYQYNHSIDNSNLFEYKTINFEEVENIFRDFIENNKLPNLANWKRTQI
ncbi:MAG: hypothetical protein FWD82_00040 [Defluviitaleaceae bacterium]|nr:hypothetical protein [Defluviitaleaceae bacterium]